MKSLGGWTRLWIVLSGSLLIFTSLDAMRDFELSQTVSQATYQDALAEKRWAVEHPTKVQPPQQKAECEKAMADGLNSLAKVVACAIAAPIKIQEPSEAREKRDKEIAEAGTEAVLQVARKGMIPSIVLGAVFFSFGWIRKGFKRREG